MAYKILVIYPLYKRKIEAPQTYFKLIRKKDGAPQNLVIMIPYLSALMFGNM
jgi:hypothetical protein